MHSHLVPVSSWRLASCGDIVLTHSLCTFFTG
jgi:hypothetical protein